MTMTEAAACGTPGRRHPHRRPRRRRARRAVRAARRARSGEPRRRHGRRAGRRRPAGPARAGALEWAAELTWSNTATQLMRVVADEVSRRRVATMRNPLPRLAQARPPPAAGARHRGRARAPAPTTTPSRRHLRRVARRPEPTAAAAARRPGRRRLRAAAADPAGLGQRRHQDLPLPRPVQADEPGVVDVGPVDRPGHGHPPEHRLPVADGPLLLAARHARRCPTGWPSACGGARSSSPPAPGVAYLLRTLGLAPGPGVTAAAFVYALTPYLLTPRGPAVGHPAALRGAAVADRADDPHGAHARGGAIPRCSPSWWPPAAASTPRPCCSWASRRCCGWPTRCGWPARCRCAPRCAPRCASACSPCRCRRGGSPGCRVQGTNGIEILRYTETATTVAAVSVSHEVLRGLGYWFFYGGDRLGPWIEPSVDYTQFLPLLGAHLPDADRSALAGGVVARWRHRAYFVMLLAVGVALAVGAYPWDDGSPWSRAAARRFLLSDVGLSMRSLPRAVPAGGAGARRAARRRASPASPAAGPATRRPAHARRWSLVALLALPPLWMGDFVPENLRRPDEIPDYWHEAAAHLDAEGPDTRVLVAAGHRLRQLPVGQHGRPRPARADGPAVGAARADPLRVGGRRPTCSTPSTCGCRSAPPTPTSVAAHRPAHAGRRRAGAERPAVRAVQHAPAPQLLGLRSPARRAGRCRPSSARRAQHHGPEECSSTTS